MPGVVTDLTAVTFDEEVVASPVPVLVEFWAPWCGPCRALGPVLDDLASDHAGRLAVRRVNADEQPELSGRFDVTAVPTLCVFDAGELRLRLVGARSRRLLEQELAALLSQPA